MSGLVELKLQPAVAAALESFGYTAADAAIREQVPAAIRGTNLVLAAPPSARHAVPVLAGLVSALAAAEARALVLAPSHALDEWAAILLPLAEQAGLQALVAVQPARATRRLRHHQLRILLTTPETALALLERSALKADQLAHVVLAWPELFDSGEALTALMQDLPAEAQRILILAAPKPGHPLVERYARRALQAGPLATAEHLPTGQPDVRMALVPWSRRGLALSRLLEAEDPASLAVWCLDEGSAREALRKVGLDSLASHAARVLSGGEQQRLALARVWALRPEILFLDEPTASLDPGATHEIERIIGELHAAGTKIVMVTHNLGQARRLGDEILFLHQGRLVERVPADRFLKHPASAEAASFLEGELPW